MTFDNGKNYAFRIYNCSSARYGYGRFGSGDSSTGWGGFMWVDTVVPEVNTLLHGDGGAFKLERTGANTLQLSLNGKVLETYTADGITESNKVVSAGFAQYGNRGYYVEIPFTLE